MEKSKEKEFVCKFCNKKFPSGKSLGGHIRIHTNQYSVDYNGNRLREKNKRLVDQREMKQQQRQLCCRECGKGFDSLKALCAHMDSHSEGEKMVMDGQSDTETSSARIRKRSKRVMRQSNSGSFSNGSSSSASEIDQEHKNTALSLMMMSRDSKGHNLVVNSMAESSENNSVILETKSSSGEHLKKVSNVKNQVLETDKVASDDQLRSAADDDNGAILCDSDSDSDYFIHGPKKSDSDISVDGSLRNTGIGSGFNIFKNSDELGLKEGGSKYELRKSKRIFPSYENGAHSLETDSCADTYSKIHRSSDSKSPMVKKASGGTKKKSKGHECPICFKVFKSGQALGGHKRSHSFENQEHRINHHAAEMRIDLNLPAMDIDE
ncbi:hypothetical protein EUTSA_v10007938mg [Eutrema salsugineum]|uniref:C2H2-type domain-containing protein n=1 Tax=Eutrema salsugineum TaxID=72664 RepID=V4L3G5_EUTSA|nr:zinc finger protein ZAT9 [Eutrema salsugineum]ESQ34288.1 hypothetical protein EUTSA_v10007938mg [Eutrema salsugineum]